MWQLHGEHLHGETALPPTPGSEFLLEGHRNLQGTLTAWKGADGTQTQPPGAPQAQQCSAVHKAWAGRVALQPLGSAGSVSGGSVAYEMYVLD